MDYSPELQAITRTRTGTRSQAIAKIWEYIQINNLHDPNNRARFFPDEKLSKIFGNEPKSCFALSHDLRRHITWLVYH